MNNDKILYHFYSEKTAITKSEITPDILNSIKSWCKENNIKDAYAIDGAALKEVFKKADNFDEIFNLLEQDADYYKKNNNIQAMNTTNAILAQLRRKYGKI